MCTSIEALVPMEGSGKGPAGWFPVTQAFVSYDHPSHAMLAQSLIIDFLNPDLGPAARAAVEITAGSARALAQAILTALEEAEAQGYFHSVQSKEALP